MKTVKYFISHYSKEEKFRILVLRNPVEECGYYWSNKSIRSMCNSTEDIKFLFDSKSEAVQVLHDLGIVEQCRIGKFDTRNKDIKSKQQISFTYEELLDIWSALDTKIIHIEKTDMCNLNKLDRLDALQQKVANAMKQIME